MPGQRAGARRRGPGPAPRCHCHCGHLLPRESFPLLRPRGREPRAGPVGPSGRGAAWPGRCPGRQGGVQAQRPPDGPETWGVAGGWGHTGQVMGQQHETDVEGRRGASQATHPPQATWPGVHAPADHWAPLPRVGHSAPGLCSGQFPAADLAAAQSSRPVAPETQMGARPQPAAPASPGATHPLAERPQGLRARPTHRDRRGSPRPGGSGGGGCMRRPRGT